MFKVARGEVGLLRVTLLLLRMLFPPEVELALEAASAGFLPSVLEALQVAPIVVEVVMVWGADARRVLDTVTVVHDQI